MEPVVWTWGLSLIVVTIALHAIGVVVLALVSWRSGPAWPSGALVEKVPDNVNLRAGTTASVVVITGTGTDSAQVPPVPRALQ